LLRKCIPGEKSCQDDNDAPAKKTFIYSHKSGCWAMMKVQFTIGLLFLFTEIEYKKSFQKTGISSI